MQLETKRKLAFFFWFVSWTDISLGISLDLRAPHVDLHIPFGFIRIGWEQVYAEKSINHDDVEWRRKGYLQKW